MKRRQSREVALQFLYRYDLAHAGEPYSDPTGEVDKHYEHFRVPEDIQAFSAKLIHGSLKYQAQIDQILEKHASNWKVGRMSYVDRSLLRMATFELIQFPDTSPSVVIDEAIELAKLFGTAESPAFINGILDAIKTAVRSGDLASHVPPFLID